MTPSPQIDLEGSYTASDVTGKQGLRGEGTNGFLSLFMAFAVQSQANSVIIFIKVVIVVLSCELL